MLKRADHGVRGTVEVRPDFGIIERRQFESVQGVAHVVQPADTSIRVHFEGHVTHEQAGVAALLAVRVQAAPVLFQETSQALDGSLKSGYSGRIPASNHRPEIRPGRRVCGGCQLDLAGGEAVLHGERNRVGEFGIVVAEEVGADDAVGALVDQNLCRSGRFTNAVVGEPSARVSESHVNVESALLGLVLEHADSDELRNGEHRSGNGAVIRCRRIGLQHVGCRDLRLEHRNRCQRHPWGVCSIASRIDIRVGGALQVLRNLDAARAESDIGRFEVQATEVCGAASTVHNEVNIHRGFRAALLGRDAETLGELLDTRDGRFAAHGDAGGLATLQQEFDEVGVETLQRDAAAVDHYRGASRAGSNVRKLERNEAAPNERNPSRKLGEVEKAGAVDEVLVAGKVQLAGHRTGSDQELVRLKARAVDLDVVVVDERRNAVQGVNAGRLEALLHALGHRIGEAVLVLHEVSPVDAQVIRVDSFVSEEAGRIDDLCSAPKDFLGVAATKRARAAIGECIHNSDAPPARRRLLRGGNAGHSGADDEQVIVVVTHGCSTSLSVGRRWVRRQSQPG